MQKLDDEIKEFGETIDSITKKLDLKIEYSDLRSLEKNFLRFALYDDLKNLYEKVVPEIGKFELKLMEMNKSIENNTHILQQFD